ncbi:MAG: gamma-glutamyltransferase family protein [Rhodobacteraceae bacterium]|nr:gamma-glutamyltransferase family protein [Paracoccaceae bacterium]
MRDFQNPGRSPVYAANGMSATSHPLAARTAVHILEDGGNAVDAAIAGAVLLGFCEPQSTGLGGDCFALVKLPNEENIISINGSGRAPAATNPNSLRETGKTCLDEYQPESITIPGAVDAFCRLEEDYGKMGMEGVLAPAIKYAREGIPVSPRVGYDWQNSKDVLQGKARNYYLLDGQVPSLGTLFRAPKQAEVLERIVREGRDGFYLGEVAEDMTDSLKSWGGVHTLEDFANNSPKYTQVIASTYKDHEVIEQPPNGQGAMALLLLNILKNFNLDSLDPFGPERTHIEIEAGKLAMDARNRFVADMDYTSRLDHLLSQETADLLASKISMNEVNTDIHKITESVHKDTIYITVVDANRMAVSLIYSIFHGFGSGIASEKFGILLHNRGAGFNLTEGHPNEIGPGKRPMHTIIPAMLRHNGKMIMPFGVMGGQYQAVGHARFLTNMVDYGFDPQIALDGPRSFFEENTSLLERGYSNATIRALEALGHQVAIPPSPHGGGQAILIDYDKGSLMGASDPRKDGCAIGY